MFERIEETLCTNCAHREVCSYKQDYLNILKAVENAKVVKEESDGKITSQQVTCYDFIDNISITCKYYQKWTAYRSKEVDGECMEMNEPCIACTPDADFQNWLNGKNIL